MNQDSEENILQTIDAVKDFIALCINGKFTPLRGTKTLPDEEKALYNLARGRQLSGAVFAGGPDGRPY